jgi:nitrite reductase/ring-hydroxylating ferredoxin subunit
MSAAELRSVAVYQRTIAASLERIWENVLDWEHLPGLHRGSFAAIRCLSEGAEGWRARLRGRGAGADGEIDVEVRLDRPKLRYVTATVAGPGVGTEIWTQLEPVEPHATRIRVEFKLPGVAPAQVEAIGRGYTALYSQLWDEDEAMMVRREAMLARVASQPKPGGASLELGPLAELRARLPLRVELAGREFRVLALGEDLVAHATLCPHWLGPLGDADLEGDTIECRWHRYRFDLRTGRSCDGRGLRLMPAPRVVIGPDQRVSLSFR